MKRRNRSNLKAILSSPISLCVILVVFLFLARTAWTMAERAEVSSERLDQAEAQLGKLEESQADLSTKVASLSTPAGVEADLRDKYHAVAPGESVAVIVDDQNGGDDSDLSAAAGQASSTVEVQGTWWQRFLDFVGF